MFITCSFAGCDSNSKSTLDRDDSAEIIGTGETSKHSPGADLSAFDIEYRIVPKSGFFRFVVCRASNVHGLAKSRLELLAERDTSMLLRDKFTECVSEFFNRHGVDSPEAAKFFANRNSELFDQLAGTMEIESESSADLGDAWAAYRIATIPHSGIRKRLEPVIRDIGEEYELTEEELQELTVQLLSAWSVGWAGNSNDFVFKGWIDPLDPSMQGNVK